MIKSATVRVVVEGEISVGTGVFIDDRGVLITCAHVVWPAFENDKRIFIEFNNQDIIEVGVLTIFEKDSVFWKKALAYDFFILAPIIPLKKKIPFLKLGDFDAAQEGGEIYTCGYPLGHPQQFLSRGIISTKYINMENSIQYFDSQYNFPRHEALLDITLNRGNSGGAIIKIGETIEDDEVIGLASFLINPMGVRADSIINAFDIRNTRGQVTFNTFDSSGVISRYSPNEMAIIFAEAFKSISIGVSGCISINYIYEFLNRLK